MKIVKKNSVLIFPTPAPKPIVIPENDNIIVWDLGRRPKQVENSVYQFKYNYTDLTKQLDFKIEDCVHILLNTLKEKDPYTYGHSLRVTEYSLLLAKAIGFDAHQLRLLELSGLMHDIGKVGVPDRVLKKPQKLTFKEYNEMKTHVLRGERILVPFYSLKDVIDGVKFHHERIDGLGYPNGLKDKDIPLFARIILVADTFDAMTSTRPYRVGLPDEVAYKELIRCAGTQFDADFVPIYIEEHLKRKEKEQEEIKIKQVVNF